MKTRTYSFDLRIGFKCDDYISGEVLKDMKSINFDFSGYISNREVFIKPINTKIISVNPIIGPNKAGTLVVQCKATVPFIPHFYISDEIKIINMNIEWNNMSDACDDSIEFVNLNGAISYKKHELGYCELRYVDKYMLIDTTSDIHHKFKLSFTGDFNREFCKDININYSINNTKRHEYTNDGIVEMCGYNIELNGVNTILSCNVYLTFAELCELISGNAKISFSYKGSPASKDMIKYICNISIYDVIDDTTYDIYTMMHTFRQNDDIIVNLNNSIEESYETVDEEYDRFRARILRQKCEEAESIFNTLIGKEALQIYNQLYKYIITAPMPMKYPFVELNKKMVHDYTDKELVLIDNIFRLFTGSSVSNFLDNLSIDKERRND